MIWFKESHHLEDFKMLLQYIVQESFCSSLVTVEHLSLYWWWGQSRPVHTQNQCLILLFLQDSIDLFLGNYAVEEADMNTPLHEPKDWKFLTVRDRIRFKFSVWVFEVHLQLFCKVVSLLKRLKSSQCWTLSLFLQLPIIMVVAFSMCIICLLMAGKITLITSFLSALRECQWCSFSELSFRRRHVDGDFGVRAVLGLRKHRHGWRHSLQRTGLCWRSQTSAEREDGLNVCVWKAARTLWVFIILLILTAVSLSASSALESVLTVKEEERWRARVGARRTPAALHTVDV